MSLTNVTHLDLDAQQQTADEVRVVEALAFAKLLAPMLANELRNLGGTPVSDNAHPESPPGSGRPAAPAEVADFIESMLEQERLPHPAIAK